MDVESVVTELALLHFSNLKGGNRRNSQVWKKRGDHSGRMGGQIHGSPWWWVAQRQDAG